MFALVFIKVPADDWLPISALMAVAMAKLLLSSDFFHDDISRLTVGFFAWLDADRLAEQARGGHVHGYVPALVCSQLIVSRRP